MLSFIPNTTFIDCEFFESTVDSALFAESTNVFFGGNITFRDNIATYGGGLTLLENSLMYLKPNTHIGFSPNHARCYLCGVKRVFCLAIVCASFSLME